MKYYKDIFIDFDDTIYDTRGNANIALQELFDDFKLYENFDGIDDFVVPYWKANMELWSQYNRGEITRPYLMVERFRRPLSMGRGVDVSEENCLRVSDRFLEFCSDKPGIIDGARETLDYLFAKGYNMHICSNGFREIQYKKLNASDTMRYFKNIILSEDAGVNKPSSAFFDYAFRTTGAELATTVMIGDNKVADIGGALASGMDAIYFNRWSDPFDEVPTHGRHVATVDRLTELMDIL